MTATPSDLDADVERAAILCELRRYDEAAVLLGRFLSLYPEAVDAWAQLCIARLGQQDNTSALTAAIRSASLAPDSGQPLRLVSVCLARLGRKEEAVLAARRAVTASPFDWTCQLQLAIALLDDRDANEAAVVATQVVSIAPQAPAAHLLLAEVARAQHRYADAELHVRHALELDPTSTTALTHLAVVGLGRFGHLRSAQLAQSTARVADALRADPRDTKLLDQLDLFLTVFLTVESVLVSFDAGLILRLLQHNGSTAARLVPVLLLAVPFVFAARTVRAMPLQVRARLGTVLRTRKILLACTLETVALGASVAAAVAPMQLRLTLVPAAAAAAFWAFVITRLHGRNTARKITGRREHLLSSLTLRIAAGSCWVLALICLAFAERQAVGAAVAVLFAAGALAIRRYRKHRT